MDYKRKYLHSRNILTFFYLLTGEKGEKNPLINSAFSNYYGARYWFLKSCPKLKVHFPLSSLKQWYKLIL